MKIIICTQEQYKAKQGIHLNCPDTWYIEDAIRTAERDMFDTIYAHYETVDGLTFKIGCGVLATLLLIAQGKYGEDVTVEVIHPAARLDKHWAL